MRDIEAMEESDLRKSLPRRSGVRRLAWILLAALLCACSTAGKPAKTPEPPTHYVHKDGFDITWRELRDGSNLVFYGVLRNNADLYLENLILTVSLLDDRGNLVDTRAFPDFPMILYRRDAAPFRMTFPCPVERGEQRVLMVLDYSLANRIGPSLNVYQTICTADERSAR